MVSFLGSNGFELPFLVTGWLTIYQVDREKIADSGGTNLTFSVITLVEENWSEVSIFIFLENKKFLSQLINYFYLFIYLFIEIFLSQKLIN